MGSTSINGCVLGSMAHMPLCLRSRHGTLRAIITCKAPTHNKGKANPWLYAKCLDYSYN
jgi:hypothetical protein